MMIVFEINRHKQQERIQYIRARIEAAFTTHKVIIEEDYTDWTCYVTVMVAPNPPYHGDIARYAVFGDQAKFAVYWEWPEN
jgi:hypothetical protein